MSGIGERLKATRELAGDLSARELGALADVAETYPALIESGVRKQVGGEIVSKLAAVLGTTTDFLLLGTGPQPTARQVTKAVTAAREKRRLAEAAS
jgi:transcriptional regulator with XRE-family HTH domain